MSKIGCPIVAGPWLLTGDLENLTRKPCQLYFAVDVRSKSLLTLDGFSNQGDADEHNDIGRLFV